MSHNSKPNWFDVVMFLIVTILLWVLLLTETSMSDILSFIGLI
jgi:hypothetical protein